MQIGLWSILGLLVTLDSHATVYTSNWWPLSVKEYYADSVHTKRTSYAGPFIEKIETDQQKVTVVRPLVAVFKDYQKETSTAYILYPLFSYEKTPYGNSWNILNLISNRNTKDPILNQNASDHITFFPLFTNRRKGAVAPDKSRAVFPIAGHLYSFFGNDDFIWFFFPFWLKTTKGEQSNYSFPWPFLRRSVGPDLNDGAFWPLAGHYKKVDADGKLVVKNDYFLWPFVYNYREALDKPVPHVRKGWLPFYAVESSEKLKSETFIWPFFGYLKKFDPAYYERQYLWPLWVQGRGKEQYTNRWAPFYTHSINKKGVDKRWVLWPFLKKLSWVENNVEFSQVQGMYVFVWAQRQTSLKNPTAESAQKVHVWPLLSYWKDGKGGRQFQFLSPLEPFFQNNKVVRHLYSPLFALYRFQQTVPGETHSSFLFNLITYDKTPEKKQFAIGPIVDYQKRSDQSSFLILKGLIGVESKNNKRTFRLFWLKL